LNPIYTLGITVDSLSRLQKIGICGAYTHWKFMDVNVERGWHYFNNSILRKKRDESILELKISFCILNLNISYSNELFKTFIKQALAFQ